MLTTKHMESYPLQEARTFLCDFNRNRTWKLSTQQAHQKGPSQSRAYHRRERAGVTRMRFYKPVQRARVFGRRRISSSRWRAQRRSSRSRAWVLTRGLVILVVLCIFSKVSAKAAMCSANSGCSCCINLQIRQNKCQLIGSVLYSSVQKIFDGKDLQ